MKGQPGGSQPWSRKPGGYNDLQLYQQQLMFKQLQELQKQKQQHHLEQETWQQSSPNQLSSLSNHATLDQLPSAAHEFTISDAPKYAWQNETMIGNVNWPQSVGGTGGHRQPNGLPYQQDQGHSSQHADEYLYGTPVSSRKTLPNQFSNFHSISNDGLDTLAGSGGQFHKSMQFNAFNSLQSDQNQYQGQMILQDDTAINQKFYQLPSQNVRGVNISENFVQFNAFRDNQEQADWSGSAQLKPSHFMAEEMVKLDETEQRLLFSRNDDANSGGMYRNLLDGDSGFNAFPSLQSGSWSALMQSAVAEASSSDTGLQNDLNESGLPQKELSSGNSATFVNYEKKPLALVENLQNEPAVTPRTFPLFGDAAMSSHEQVSSFFNRPSSKLDYNQDGELNMGFSHSRLLPSSKVSPSQMDINETHSQFRNPNKSQMHFRDASVGSWTGLLCEQPSNSLTVEESQTPLNLQESWASQQSRQTYTMGSQSYNRMNGLRINEASSGSVLKLHDQESPSSQPSHMRTVRGSMHLQKEHEKSAPTPRLPGGFHFGNSDVSTNQVQTGNFRAVNFSSMNPYNSNSTEVSNQHSLALNQSEYRKSQGNEENHSQVWESAANFSSRASVEAHERRKEKHVQKVLDEGYPSTNSYASEGIDKASVLFGIQSRPSSSGSGKDQAYVGASSSGTGRFQLQPVGNFRDNVDPDAQKHNIYAQGQELRNQDQGYILSSHFVSRPALNNTGDVEKKSFESLESVKGSGKGHSGGSIFCRDSNIPNSFDESAAFLTQNRTAQSSQNMLELLHKLDQTRENNLLPGHVFSNRNPISERPDTSSTTPTLQKQALTLQGSGLHLSPPSQQLQPMPPRALHDHDLRRQIDRMHDTQRESLDDARHSSELLINENSRTSSITSSSPRFFLHQQQQSGNVPLHNQIDAEEHIRDASDVSGQVLPPGSSSKMSSDVRPAQSAAQLQSARSSMAGFSAYSTPQPVTRPGGSHQGAFSTMLQNVWSQVSAQRQLNPSFSQSVSSSQLDEHRSQKSQSTAIGEQHTPKEGSARQLLSVRSSIPHGADTSSKSSPAEDSSMTTSPASHNKSKLDQSPSHSLLLNIAAAGTSRNQLKPSSVEHPNYSLLQQMQAMKALESDPSKRNGKRPKPADSAPDSQQLAAKPPQTLIYGYNGIPRAPPYKELNLPASQIPFTSDSKMLCFSSNASADDREGRKETQSQGLTSVRLNDHHHHHHQLRGNNVTSSSSQSIDPQMAPSWFGQYNKIKSDQILSVYNSFSDQKPARRMPNSMEVSSSSGKVNDSALVESVSRSPSAVAVDQISPTESPADVVDLDLVRKPKRHKTSLSARLPWHKEIVGISVKLPSVSMAESSWAYAANRLIDKVDDESDVAEDAILGFRSRRRLILTTQLIQLLFPAVPAKILRSDPTLYYDSVMFLAARLALGGACGGISLSRRDHSVVSSKPDMPETSNCDKDREGSFSKVAEDFDSRARKMEDDLSRFESALSIPDLRVECQDLERFSMINRFAKFHSRAQPMGVEILPTSEAAHRRIYPQRYVAAMPMQMVPPNLADGYHCFSL